MNNPSHDAPPVGAPSDTHRLWGGRFNAKSAAIMDAVNRSIGVDFRLWPFDVQLSKAWAVALQHAGVLTAEERDAIDVGLDAVGVRLAAGESPIDSDEDIHTMIDRLLHEEAGAAASKLHTGRSRNDQVATASRLWTIDACARLDAAIRELQLVLLTQAEPLQGAILPAYTHMQRAIPVSAAHWLLSHFWPLERDRLRLAAASRGTSTLPLGSGAVAGCAFPISRELLKGALGFNTLSANSIDAVADRDFVAEVIFVCALMATHLSKLAEDLILYGSSEFGFVKFGDGYSTGSSMMPQKRNPDALEIARGSAGRVLGDLVSLMGTLKGLPSGYNKDLQDDKRAMFGAVDTMLLVLPAVAGAVSELTFDTVRMRGAVSSGMMATDLADYLVEQGISFREAHKAVGSLVRQCEETGLELHTLPRSAFASAHTAFGDDVYDALSPQRSLERREVEGGTGPDAVRVQIEQARLALTPAGDATGREGALFVGRRP
ncbi:MAG: argininosuccinate lyase [Gemmatimonadetes bacterium]|nr:argininosuccinate lyase [Gemmatimonadota bacterium]MCC6769609.1 argininosuccinate lyase [Gemmatimonadaceae bacterium]